MRLELDRIGHAFLGRAVFENLSLSLGQSEVVALVGPSGCGKTTVLQIAAGLVDPLRGRVRRGYRCHAVVFQEPRLLPWMTARDNIAYGLAAGGTSRAVRHAIAERRAAEVGLHARDLDKYPAELSGGMRQRAAVARALAVDPEIVFFDEPFTAVDVGLRRVLQDLVIEASGRDGFSALFVTHDLSEAVRLAHRVIVLSGRQEGILAERRLDGPPGSRDDRAVFELVQDWTRDPAFADLFDGSRDAA
ncbi:nitrate/sulfonate/bicarbonate ABC transporter ATP-binding protein [Bosea sp. Root381]|uniref:ABC transporter ATP-binding protein n=1 Tax=Bosea sp. Root381 TaxID=1736524 RepID=UPI0006F6287F|nr:ATP-binding cassette domain-containing protein [Bosea sp. Root381]KRD95876.1 nitrate/sulfonate/bicarbonate ABC transporter ATP-binding protein [Bosea sp. Root381]